MVLYASTLESLPMKLPSENPTKIPMKNLTVTPMQNPTVNIRISSTVDLSERGEGHSAHPGVRQSGIVGLLAEPLQVDRTWHEIRPSEAVVEGTLVGHILLEQVRGSPGDRWEGLIWPERRQEVRRFPDVLLPREVGLI